MPKRVHFVSLGCAKNTVDSQVMLGHLVQGGYEPTDDASVADLIVVNTCGFLDAAKEESVDTILEMSRFKTEGRCDKLVVTGCLSQRYAPDLAREIPEVDHFLGTGNFEEILAHVDPEALEQRAQQPVPKSGLRILQATSPEPHATQPSTKPHPRLGGHDPLVPYRHPAAPDGSHKVAIPDPDFTLSAASPRLLTGPQHSVYLKISDGCSNTCAFCVIPKLRGPQRSRPVDDVVREARGLLALGAVELNLIAQDLCAYGKDREPRQTLAQLLRALDDLADEQDHPVWIRSLYAYPRGLTREVIDVLARARHIVPYLDMPLQHISDHLLRRMRRGKGGTATRELVRRLRTDVPGLHLRTTLITGLPGETEGDFAELVDFVAEARFEQLGVFAYSPEEDTPAALMTGQVERAVADARREQVMALQRRISAEQQQAFLGLTVEVLVDGVSEETDLLLVGRHAGQAPDIDGVTYINDGEASPGDLVRVRIDQAGDYDLVGGIVSA